MCVFQRSHKMALRLNCPFEFNRSMTQFLHKFAFKSTAEVTSVYAPHQIATMVRSKRYGLLMSLLVYAFESSFRLLGNLPT